ncbi:histidinol phosphate phosphatase domain-containing protein [Candidatus Acetothermia bacterium]|nr:histidinol phosphate phosphatase domain-containing protein [Candidatus Acetothermia bacterium]
MKRREFHSHTGLSSDGTWAPLEMIRCARDRGQASIALTDHVGVSNVEPVLEALRREREAAKIWSDIEVFIGVEITHVPAPLIAEVAQRARRAGAEIILVHGETLAEPVEPGTNRAAASCPEVDVVAHPGLIMLEDAQLAEQNGKFLELSARRGHCLTNGHVAQMAHQAGAKMLVNTDAHEPSDLINVETALRIALGAGLSETEAQRIVGENVESLAQKIRQRPQ